MNLFDFYRFNKSVTMFKMSKFGQNRLFSGANFPEMSDSESCFVAFGLFSSLSCHIRA